MPPALQEVGAIRAGPVGRVERFQPVVLRASPAPRHRDHGRAADRSKSNVGATTEQEEDEHASSDAEGEEFLARNNAPQDLSFFDDEEGSGDGNGGPEELLPKADAVEAGGAASGSGVGGRGGSGGGSGSGRKRRSDRQISCDRGRVSCGRVGSTTRSQPDEDAPGSTDPCALEGTKPHTLEAAPGVVACDTRGNKEPRVTQHMRC